MLTWDEVPARVSELMDGRPVRWMPLGPKQDAFFEGAERTLQIFDTEAREMRRMYAQVDDAWPELQAAAGGHIVLFFYDAEQTARYFPEMSRRRAARGAT